MMPKTGRNISFALAGRIRIRLFVLAIFALLSCVDCISAHAQRVAPADMTFVCSPDPIYVGASAMCKGHVAGGSGGATGSVSLYLGSLLFQNIPLDSNGDVSGPTSAFGPGPGIYVITGVYSGDSNYLPTQRDVGLTVYSGQVIVTAETLVCSPYLAYVGNPIRCKMHLPAGSTGTVAFAVAGNAWTTVPVDSNGDAVAVNGLPGAAVGDYRITATYSGDTNFAPATATTTAVVTSFKPEPNAMSVGCSPSPLVAGNQGTCTVDVGGGATGSVDLYVHDQYLTTLPLNSSGVATIGNIFGTLPAGSYGVRAVYTGDANFDYASAATTVNINTGTQTPTLTISCNPTALSPGSGTNCTAQAPTGATGNIQFYVGANQWTSVPLDGNGRATAVPVRGKYEGDPSGLPVGSYSVVAYYPGDLNFATASAGVTVSIQVTKPTPNIIVSCTPNALVSGNATTCTASVGQGATGAVLFGLSGQPTSGLTLDPNGNVVFQNQLSGVPAGSYALEASYAGDINFAPTSATTAVVVSSQQATPPMTASLTPAVIRNGGSVQVNVNVGGGATGSVEMILNGGHYLTMPLDPTGSFVGATHVTTPGDGSWTLTLNYSGDANFLPTTRDVQITTGTPPLTLGCSPGTIVSGGSASCTAQVAGATTGTISVYLDGALQATSGVDQSGSVAITIPPTSLAVGTHTVIAGYFLADQTPSGTASQSITVTSGSTQPSGYSYSITDSNGNSGYDSTGNVVAYSDSINGQWVSKYDGLNRLISAETAGQYHCWRYDSFGNRIAQGIQSSPCPSADSPIPLVWTRFAIAPSNQLLGILNPDNSIVPSYNYDFAGNMTSVQGDGDILSGVLYDGEGRVCATRQYVMAGIYRQTQYVYDTDGHRVAEGNIIDWTKGCDMTLNESGQPKNGFQQTKAYIVGPSGEQMTELNTDATGASSWVHSNIYAEGQLIASYANDNGATTLLAGKLHFVISDWLGTKRVQTTFDGNNENVWGNLPFGESQQMECPNCNGGDASEHHFTGKERDTESGLDYFGARYYNSAMGRFISPDWSAVQTPVPYATLDNPQSLNLYTYGFNHPLNTVDTNGHCNSGTSQWLMSGGYDALAAAESCDQDAMANYLNGQRKPTPPPQQGSSVEAKRDAIGKAAAGQKDSKKWAYDCQPRGWKCNVFVHDVLRMVGIGGNGQPTAGQLADPKYHMTGWTDATNGDFAQLHVGDIVAYAYPPGTHSDATGDSGIITSIANNGNSIQVTAAGQKSVYREALSKWRAGYTFMVRTYVGP